MIDIGVNLTSSQFNDVSTVLSNAQENNVKKIIVTGTSVQESKNAISLCQDFEEMFPNMLHSTVGIHPHEASSFSSSSLKELKNLAKHECVVAIETGLDYYRNFSPKEFKPNLSQNILNSQSTLDFHYFCMKETLLMIKLKS